MVPGRPRRRPTSGSSALRWAAVLVVALNFGRVHEFVPAFDRLPVGMILLPLAALVVLLSPGAGARLRAVFATPQGRSLVLLLVVAAVSVPFSIVKSTALDALWQWARAQVLPLILLAASVRRVDDLVPVARSLAGCAGFVGAMTAKDALRAGGAGPIVEGRFAATAMFDANDIALLCVVGLPFALWLVTNGRDRWWDRALGLAGIMGALAGVLFSGSRGGFLALGAVVLSQALLFGRYMPVRWRLLFAAIVAAGLLFPPSGFWNRMGSIMNWGEDYNVTSSDGRLAVWTRGLSYFARSPLTGVGFAQFPNAEGYIYGREAGPVVVWRAAHNSFVQVLAELGVLGFAAWLGMFVPTIWLAWRLRRRTGGSRAPPLVTFGEALTIALLGYATGGFFLSAAYLPVATVQVGVGVAWTALVRAEQRAAPHPFRGHGRGGLRPKPPVR